MAAIFAILLADRVATGAPVLLAVLLGAALLLTMVLENRRAPARRGARWIERDR